MENVKQTARKTKMNTIVKYSIVYEGVTKDTCKNQCLLIYK